MTETAKEAPNTKESPTPPTKRRKVEECSHLSPVINNSKGPDVPQNGNAVQCTISDKPCLYPPLSSVEEGNEPDAHRPINSGIPSCIDLPITSTPSRPYATNNPIVVVRGPQILDGVDEVRPPRRPEKTDELLNSLPFPDEYGNTTNLPDADDMAVCHLQPTGLAPAVDLVLSKIFSSGLFERKDIDGRALDFLGSVSSQLALAALEDIQRRDFSTVRNKPAFIMSIFKRVVAGGGTVSTPMPIPPSLPYAPTSVPASALAHLPPTVSDALQRVFTSGVCHPSQFDDRAMDILVDLQEPDAVRALSEFAAMEPGRVRNPSAFWMGLARKYKGHSRAPGGRMGPSYDAPPGGRGSGGYGGFEGGVGYDVRRIGKAGSGGGSIAGGGGGSAGLLDQRLDELSMSGHLLRSALDDRAVEALRRLPEQEALGVLAELPEPALVRNMSAYVMGLCKKFASGEARSLSQRGSGYGSGGGGGGYGGAYGGGYNSATPYVGTYTHTSSVPSGYPSGYGAGAVSAYGTNTYSVNPMASGGNYGGPSMLHAEPLRTRDIREILDGMDPAVRERFYQLTEQRVITETSFDSRAIGALQSMRREEACAALDELAASEPGRINNVSAYFMGLAKKFRRPSM